MKNTIKTLVLVLILIGLVSSYADANNLDNIDEKIHDFIEEREKGTVGLSIGVFKDGRLIYENQYGYIDVENQIPVDQDTVFEWGSVSKVLIWISIMQEVEKGNIDLDQDIKSYLPKDFISQLKYDHPLTVKDLMNHSAGFQEITYPVEFKEGEEIPPLDEILLLSQPSQIYEPGTIIAYNNWSSALAAYIVESVSGLKFYDYVHKNIFQPLDMKHTAIKADWSDNEFVQEQRKISKSYNFTSESQDSLGTSIIHIGLYPAGACAGTFEDFLTFASEFTKDHPRFFKNPQTFQDMKSSSRNYDNQDPRIHHGLWSMDYKTHVLGHSGNTIGYTSSFFFDPQDQIGYVVMTNEIGETAYNYGLGELIFGKLQHEPVQGRDISGIYTSRRTIDQGFARFIKYLSGILPIKTTDQANIFEVALVGINIKSLGDNIYYFDNENGLSYKTVLKDDGKTLESYTSDYYKISNIELAFAYILILSMLITIISFVIRVFIMLYRLIRNKDLKVKAYLLRSHIAATIISLTFFYIWIITSNYLTRKMMVLFLIFTSCTIIIFANTIYQIYLKSKGHDRKIFRLSLSIFPVIAVIFFQLYNFWA